MTFQATIIPPTGKEGSKLWELQVPIPDPDNKNASFETVSHFVRISLCMGYTGAYPEITKSENGIHIKFEGGHGNFEILERVLEWLMNPRPYAY